MTTTDGQGIYRFLDLPRRATRSTPSRAWMSGSATLARNAAPRLARRWGDPHQRGNEWIEDVAYRSLGGEIRGMVFFDSDAGGDLFEEGGIAGIRVALDGRDGFHETFDTLPGGTYIFSDLAPGDYVLSFPSDQRTGRAPGWPVPVRTGEGGADCSRRGGPVRTRGSGRLPAWPHAIEGHVTNEDDSTRRACSSRCWTGGRSRGKPCGDRQRRPLPDRCSAGPVHGPLPGGAGRSARLRARRGADCRELRCRPERAGFGGGAGAVRAGAVAAFCRRRGPGLPERHRGRGRHRRLHAHRHGRGRVRRRPGRAAPR